MGRTVYKIVVIVIFLLGVYVLQFVVLYNNVIALYSHLMVNNVYLCNFFHFLMRYICVIFLLVVESVYVFCGIFQCSKNK